MKEDAQLICPISFHDPNNNVWSLLQPSIFERLPLRDISWKSTGAVSLSQGHVEKLPLRFMPSTASLFKDTDHPFRWFLAPYGNIYFISADTLEAYKDARPAIKKWVETVVGLKRASWLLVFTPINNNEKTPDPAACAKVYARICSDFYVERSGDRSINFSNVLTAANGTEDNIATAYEEFFIKVKEGVVASFFQRSALYDVDIRRLDSSRGSSQFDFRQLFLVKESLALMYQLMQLPQEALRQYGELEALLGVVPDGILPRNDWPLTMPEDCRVSGKAATMLQPQSMPNSDETSSDSATTDGAQREFESLWRDPLTEGESVLAYSINSARMRILKNKIGIRELRRYVFSRQMHFLALQFQCRDFTAKGAQYIKDTHEGILQQMIEERDTDRHRRRQADLWAVCAAVKVVRSSRLLLISHREPEQGVVKGPTLASAANSTSGTCSSGYSSSTDGNSSCTADASFDASEAMEAVLRKKIALSREMHLLRDCALPLGDLLRMASRTLHSLSTSICDRPDEVDKEQRRFSSDGVESGSGSGSPLRLTAPGSIGHSRSRYSHYRHRSASLALSLNEYRSSAYNDLNHADASSHAPFLADDFSPALFARREVDEVTRAASLAMVQEALHADLDKVLSVFPFHLRHLLEKDKDKEGDRCISDLSSWCPLSAVLYRAVAAHEELAGWMRSAGRSRLSCADLLLCHGYYHQASVCYFDGIWRGRVSRGDDLSAWEDVERLSLLKILYCSSAVEDRATYMRAAVLLCAVSSRGSKTTDPSPRVPSTPSDCPVEADAAEPVKLMSDSQGAHPFQSHFRVNTDHVMTVTSLVDISEDGQSRALGTTRPTLESDGFYVAPGAQYILSLSIVSLFACSVSLDEICATFEKENAVPFSGQDSTGGTSSFSAVCRATSAEFILLLPGVHQVLSLHFTAPSSGSSEEAHRFTCIEMRAVAGNKPGRDDEGQPVSFVMTRAPSISLGVERALSHSPSSFSPKKSDTEVDSLSSASDSLTLSLLPCIIVSHMIDLSSQESLRSGGVNSSSGTHPHLPTIEGGVEARLSPPMLIPCPPLLQPTSISVAPQSPLHEVVEVKAEFLSQILLRNVSESARRVVGIRVINGASKAPMSISSSLSTDHIDSKTPPSTSTLQGVTAQCAYIVTVLHCPLCTCEGIVPSGSEKPTADPGSESGLSSSSVPVLLPGEAYSAALQLRLTASSASESVKAMLAVDSGVLWDPSLVIYFESGHPSSSSSSPVSQSEVVVSLLGFVQQVAKLMGEKHGGVWVDIAADPSLRMRVGDSSDGYETAPRDCIEPTDRSDKDIGGVTESTQSESAHGLVALSGTAKTLLSRSPCRALGPSQRILTKAIKSDRPTLHSSSHPRGTS